MKSFEVEESSPAGTGLRSNRWRWVALSGSAFTILLAIALASWHLAKAPRSGTQQPHALINPLEIPRILHFVVEHDNDESQEKIRGDMLGVDLTGWEVKIHDAAAREVYVRERLPDYESFYLNLPLPIMKADVFRYMVIHEEGGFYADDDVDFFAAFRTNFEDMKDQEMIVGWERRTPSKPIGAWCEDYGGMLCNSLAMWAFGARPRHPALKDVVDTCRDFFSTHPDIDRENPQHVLVHTGPVHFTKRLLKFIAVDDVLGIEAFGCGQTHSNSPWCDPYEQNIWLKHRFEGKWKPKPRGNNSLMLVNSSSSLFGSSDSNRNSSSNFVRDMFF